MSNTRLFLAVGLVCLLASAAVRAAETEATEAEPAVLLDTIRDNRRALIAVNLELSPEETDKFWPLYERYQKDVNAAGDRIAAIADEYIATFRTLSNDKAMQLIESYLAAEADRLQVRRTYLPEFAKILPGRTVARFYQIENKMDAVLRYDLAATIPVVEEKPTPAP